MSTQPSYLLMRDLNAAIRLNCQHYLLKDMLGYSVDPSIPFQNLDDLKVADLGTGTGVWCLDLSNKVSDKCTFEGYDVSADQFPAKEYLPDNVVLRVMDCCQGEPPAELVGRYDLVNVRLFCGVVSGGNPTSTLQKAIKMLRPGGYLQWLDYDPASVMFGSTGNQSTPNSRRAIQGFRDLRDMSWVSELDKHFEKAGLEVVNRIKCHEHVWQRRMFSEDILAVCQEVATNSYGLETEAGRSYLQALKAAYEEVAAGAFMTFSVHLVVGRKP